MEYFARYFEHQSLSYIIADNHVCHFLAWGGCRKVSNLRFFINEKETHLLWLIDATDHNFVSRCIKIPLTFSHMLRSVLLVHPLWIQRIVLESFLLQETLPAITLSYSEPTANWPLIHT